MESDRERERRWRAEERADCNEVMREANKHREDCLCWAVNAGWQDGDPACIQNGLAWRAYNA